MHHKVRITVVKRCLNMDLVEQFVPEMAEVAKACPVFVDGQQFEIDLYPPAQPDGFCGWAWFDIQRALGQATDGADMGFGNSFPTCGDGLRPVVFHIEQLDEEAPDRDVANKENG
jgi:uncharacterized repeat protein (TIGR04076 family)